MRARFPLLRSALVALLCAALAGGCAADGKEDLDVVEDAASSAHTPAPVDGATTPAPVDPPSPEQTAEATPSPTPESMTRPAWLGTRELPLRSDGYGEIQPTPPELVDRRLPPPPLLPPPADDTFAAEVVPVPDEALARSTWSEACPVTREDLRYITLTFWGFDDRPHTGELLVHADAAEPLVEVFRALYEARFPIEEMRVVASEELDLHPTGDGNNTTAFVCRPSRGQTAWSQHALGLAVDINPFHNPYRKGEVVLPELASAYVDRDWHRPGMIQPGDVVTQGFAAIGWGWGGDWRSLDDWMHFSANGR